LALALDGQPSVQEEGARERRRGRREAPRRRLLAPVGAQQPGARDGCVGALQQRRVQRRGRARQQLGVLVQQQAVAPARALHQRAVVLRLAAALLAAQQLGGYRVRSLHPDGAVARGVVEHEHLRLERQRRLLARDRVEAALEQHALLGVDDAVGDLDAHPGSGMMQEMAASPLKVEMDDPSAFTPPYDHALCAALARAGADVELATSRFAYGAVPRAEGYAVREAFYRRAPGGPGSRLRRAAKLAQHVPDMLRFAASRGVRDADVVHFQWLTVQPLDVRLLPRSGPLVLTAHDVLPREPRPGQLRAQRRLYDRVDAVVVHSEHGAERLRDELGIDPGRVHALRRHVRGPAPV